MHTVTVKALGAVAYDRTPEEHARKYGKPERGDNWVEEFKRWNHNEQLPVVRSRFFGRS